MKTLLRLAMTLSVACFAQMAWAEEDAEGCKDHPLFNRMPGYYINSCEIREFDSRDFPASGALDADNKPVKVETVEGTQTYIVYSAPSETTHASGLQIQRNYENAVKAAGGVVIASYGAEASGKQLNDDTWGAGDRATALKLNKGGKEIWAVVLPYNSGNGYALYIGERQAMKQDVVANELLDKLNSDGFISLYINFDTGKGTIKPDSFPQLDQVVAALKLAQTLKLEVGGHTDNVGTPASNLALSEARAKSVMTYLTGKGIAATRLTVKGYGQNNPVADNRSEEGRAKNRRVELVKK